MTKSLWQSLRLWLTYACVVVDPRAHLHTWQQSKSQEEIRVVVCEKVKYQYFPKSCLWDCWLTGQQALLELAVVKFLWNINVALADGRFEMSLVFLGVSSNLWWGRACIVCLTLLTRKPLPSALLTCPHSFAGGSVSQESRAAELQATSWSGAGERTLSMFGIESQKIIQLLMKNSDTRLLGEEAGSNQALGAACLIGLWIHEGSAHSSTYSCCSTLCNNQGCISSWSCRSVAAAHIRAEQVGTMSDSVWGVSKAYLLCLEGW